MGGLQVKIIMISVTVTTGAMLCNRPVICLSTDVSRSTCRNVVKKEADKLLKCKDLLTEMPVPVAARYKA
jgi:hypothetical protein